MIESIDIKNFGSFHDFVWNDYIRDSSGNIKKFQKLNIIYGRNYSGKTTLSRIFRCLHTGALPQKYNTPLFEVKTDSDPINQNQIPATDHNIRVYNKDYVDTHLGFLKDNDGKITPFAIIGSENNEIELQISEKENELGDVDKKTGLKYQHSVKLEKFISKNSAKLNKSKDIKGKLTKKATQKPVGIKHNPIYKDPNYNTPKIEADIRKIRTTNFEILTDKEKTDRLTLLNEVTSPDIANIPKFTPSLKKLHSDTRQLLSKKITPTEPIQELLNDALLQSWVKEGIPFHKGKRDICGFCGQPIPIDLWKKLDEHFSKESIALEKDIDIQIQSIEKERIYIESLVQLKAAPFYSSLHGSFNEAKEAYQVEIGNYVSTLASLTKKLLQRKSSIFSPVTIFELTDNSATIESKISAINAIIIKHNEQSKSLEGDQRKAVEELRLSEIAQFVQDIDLTGEERKLSNLQKEADKLKKEAELVHDQTKKLDREIEALKIQLKDERKGAEKVNEYLNHYFGHDAIRLEAVEDNESATFKFQIMRGDQPAYNLSEGECSLVSFCYFMAKLEDTESKGKNLLIFIDDPISSLDSNHIFFVYSLINSFLAKPTKDEEGNKVYPYEQLFISTHNLEFLKYLKKLPKPKKKHEQFIVVGKSTGSLLELMPSYLKNYITEFNYLFGEICTCANPANATSDHHCFYNFGNNLRKFLEAFLFFKYPFSVHAQGDYNRRIEMFFKDDPGTEPLVQRLTNEFSHLSGGFFDRSIQPIDHAEISKLATFVLKKIKDNDSEQFHCLLESINKSDPLTT